MVKIKHANISYAKKATRLKLNAQTFLIRKKSYAEISQSTVLFIVVEEKGGPLGDSPLPAF